MNVLLVNSTCKVGGISSFMLGLRAALLAQGHRCQLFFFEHGTMEARLPPDCQARFGSLADCLELVAREGIDVVHANNIDWTTGISAVRHIGARLIVTAHKSRDGAWTYGWTRRNCDAFTAVSRGVAARLQPFTDAPIRTVYNGIDLSRFVAAAPGCAAGAAGPPIVAWIGRSGSPLKGFEKLAAIAPHLARGGARIWVIDQHGQACARERYPAAASALLPYAERWDSVAFERMADLYRDVAASGGCVLSTSVAEGLPLALLEAQAAGCLAVASDVPGNDEAVLPSHGGIRYPLATDGAEIARLMLAALADHVDVRRRQQATALHVRARFGVERMAKDYVAIYRGEAGAPPLAWGARLRGGLRLSPPLHWRAYVEQRVGVGYAQFAAARQLTGSGHPGLAAGAGLAAARTSPTIFLRPARLARLLRMLRRDAVDHQQRLVVGGHDPGTVSRVEDVR